MEKLYKTTGTVGAGNTVLVIIKIVTGFVAGILTIVGGGRLLAGRKKIMF